jgi:integrase
VRSRIVPPQPEQRISTIFENHFFENSCIADWQRSLTRLSKVAGIKFHAHMLRDSFAIGLLEKRVSLENVAVLLGNSVKIAERHYATWVRVRQEALEKDIERAWKLTGRV